MRRIGELLVEEGLLSEAAVNRALGFQRLSGDRVKLGSILLNWDLLAEEALLKTLAKSHRCPAVDWLTLSAAPIEIVQLLSSAHAARLGAIPYELEKGALRVAFVNPSNLAAIDEVSAITAKRVVPCVTTEVRLIQAHQKFYGRHIPGALRTIVQRLERRTIQTPRDSGTGSAVDLGSSDLAQPGTSLRQSMPVDNATGTPWPTFPSPSFAIPSAVLPAAPSTPTPMTPTEMPETPLTIPIEALSPLEPAAAASSSAQPPVSGGQENLTGRSSTDSPSREDSIRSGEDSLAQWLGEALAAFQQERGLGRSSDAATPRPSVLSQPSEAAAAAEEAVSGMWRPSPLEETDEGVSGMWTSATEGDSQLWEARSREEIGEAVLQNALTGLPRVLLFGSGKIAITGWRGRGPNFTAIDIASVRIPVLEKSVFANVRKSGLPHFGPVEPGEWPRALAEFLGETPLDCAVFPIRIPDGVAAFLYVDRLGVPMQYQDFALIARAASSTANVLARFLLRSNAAPVS